MSSEKQKFFHRELAWIEFNQRVFAETSNPENPILERLKFLGITASNFDEFFMVRVASLDLKSDIAKQVYRKSFELMDAQNQCWQNELSAELKELGIVGVKADDLDQDQMEIVGKFFYEFLYPLLTPIAIYQDDPTSLNSLSNYLAFHVDPKKEGEVPGYAVVEIPKSFPRMISLPSNERYAYILVEDVIRMFAHELFEGCNILSTGMVRISRAAEMNIDEEKDADFAEVMTDVVNRRRDNFIVRLEIAADQEMKQFFMNHFHVDLQRVYDRNICFDYSGLSKLAFQSSLQEFARPGWTPISRPEFEDAEEIWDAIKEKDRWVHHPYDSFDSVIHFLNAAAQDPNVLAIKQTLYRTASESRVVQALKKAAQNGKHVSVLIELKARFDERANIAWAKDMEHAGINVIYGLARLKTHAKACLVVREELEGIKRYVHLGTGNYNEKTASLYTDMGYFSADEELSQDVASFFNVVTGYSHPVGFSKIEMAPTGLRAKFLRLIEQETKTAKKGEKAVICAKMNSLVDDEIICALYDAADAGVEVKLNIRGVCRLNPDYAKHIEVVSVIDMFLEHSRIFYFYSGGEERTYLSSADWMQRNLDRRIEIAFPVLDKNLRNDMKKLLFQYFEDNTNAWVLNENGFYNRKNYEALGEKRFRIQEVLCKKALEAKKKLKIVGPKDFKLQKPKS